MLIDFTVENYRSIKEPVTLSAIAHTKNRRATSASARRRKSDAEIAPAREVPGRDLELLPVLGIFGANASGKSNVIQALERLISTMHVGTERGIAVRWWVTPFKLDPATVSSPSAFKVRFAVHDTIFVYRLELDRTRVYQETLEYLPAAPAQMRLLFDRRWDSESATYIWKNGPDFRGPHTQLETSLRPSEVYFAMFVERIQVPVLVPLTDWLAQSWVGVGLGYENPDQQVASALTHGNESRQDSLSRIVRKFDTGIAGLSIVRNENAEDDRDEYEILIRHTTPEGDTVWPLTEESLGTQRLFTLACRMRDALEYGTVMLVDELGYNLHPSITRYIVRIFQSPKTNPNGAQLIFTSHDSTLTRSTLLRRDQIWFTAKRPDHSTDLYPLTDFSPRNDLAIDRAYLDGRFGAVPVLPPEEEMFPLEAAK